MRNRLLAFVVVLATAAAGTAQDAAPKTKAWQRLHTYPMDVCVVSGKALKPEKAKTFEVDGRTFKTCCGRCKAKVEKDPAPYAAKLDDAIAKAQLAGYPTDRCVISGKPLGKKTQNLVLDGTLVRVCCPGCVKKAKARSADVVAKIEAMEVTNQRAGYPLKVCPVSGEDLDADAADVLCNGTLVRLCCDHCIKDLKKDSAKVIAAVQKARGKTAPAAKKAVAGTTESCCDDDAKAGGCCQEGAEGAKSGGCCQEQAGEAKAGKKASGTLR